MILSCQSICKSFWGKGDPAGCFFSHRRTGEKAALIGNNGAGENDSSSYYYGGDFRGFRSVVIAKDKKIGYLAQYQDIHGHHTIYEGTDDHQAVHFGYGGQDPFSGTGNEIRSRRQT